jgi:hypothetical protein
MLAEAIKVLCQITILPVKPTVAPYGSSGSAAALPVFHSSSRQKLQDADTMNNRCEPRAFDVAIPVASRC